MGIQLALPLDRDPRAPRPDERRAAPAVWVRRLWILRDLAPGDDHVLRRLDLRRGLNILWAAPTPVTDQNRLFQGRLSGHTAGKTTFCRLIRYVLGEPTFGAQALRHRIRSKFPNAWVVGEVMIGDAPWAVARPLGIGPHPFAVRGAGIEGVFDGSHREELDSFVEAVEAAAVKPLPVTRLPHSDYPLRWEHLLPWLSRDQESRFASFVDWRDPSSEAESPKLAADDRYVLLRAVLGLISDDERAEQRANAELVLRKQEAATRAPILAHQVEVDRRRLVALIGAGEGGDALVLDQGPLFGDARGRLAARRATLDAEELALAEDDEVAGLRSAWEAAVAARADAGRIVSEAEGRLAAARGDGVVGGREGLLPMFSALSADRAVCSVPLATARAEGCPLVSLHAADGEAAVAEAAEPRPKRDRAKEATKAKKELVAQLASELADARTTLDRAKGAEQDAYRALAAVEKEQKVEAARLAKERGTLERAEWLLGELEEETREAEATEEELGQIERDLKRSYERQEAFRKRHAAALGRISDRFGYVVRALLGEQVTGRIEDDGRHLALRVEEHGDRESAAITTLKLLAFDLAVLTASVEGHGRFPRLLIHDGPREADMDQTIYERLFLYAKSLEDAFSGEPSFQYIVTTTAAPPAELRKAPWLIQPVLDASTASGRLLGVDL